MKVDRMKAVVSIRGNIEIINQELPQLEAGMVLIETSCSAISSGTELLLKNNMADYPIPLGYSAMGYVREVGEGVTHVQVGQRAACYGSPYVKHAEWLAVPKHLVIPLPDECRSSDAAFVGIGAIAIHALRQSDLHFGETIVIVGLGILGQIAGRIAEASGYRLIGFDLLEERCSNLSESGVNHVYSDESKVQTAIDEMTHEQGADAVIICANGANPGIINQALHWIRDRGKVIIVGDVGMSFDRELMFSKEAQILISRAGGPGRYDNSYEREGADYPIGYIRWTEGRNMAEFIRLLSEERISIETLITHEMNLSSLSQAYELLRESPRSVLGVLVHYEQGSGASAIPE